MSAEVIVDKTDPSSWRSEIIHDDGTCEVSIFCGPQAHERAMQYHGARLAVLKGDVDFLNDLAELGRLQKELKQ